MTVLLHDDDMHVGERRWILRRLHEVTEVLGR